MTGDLKDVEGAALAGPTDNANPILSQIVAAAIAYTDALTSKHRGRVNQKNHNAAVKALRDALENRLPAVQERRLRRILGEKDAAQYGTRRARMDDAIKLLSELERFAAWAEEEVKR